MVTSEQIFIGTLVFMVIGVIIGFYGYKTNKETPFLVGAGMAISPPAALLLVMMASTMSPSVAGGY